MAELRRGGVTSVNPGMSRSGGAEPVEQLENQP